MATSTQPLARSSQPPARRAVLLIAGLALLAGGVAALGPLALALWFLPDLALLAGLGGGFAEHGRLAPRAVPAYNALHRIAGPIVLAGAALAVGDHALAGVAAVWGSHVLIDRALGYGLRTADGWQRG